MFLLESPPSFDHLWDIIRSSRRKGDVVSRRVSLKQIVVLIGILFSFLNVSYNVLLSYKDFDVDLVSLTFIPAKKSRATVLNASDLIVKREPPSPHFSSPNFWNAINLYFARWLPISFLKRSKQCSRYFSLYAIVQHYWSVIFLHFAKTSVYFFYPLFSSELSFAKILQKQYSDHRIPTMRWGIMER